MKIICQDRRQQSQRAAPEGRVVGSVASDVDRLLAPKNLMELEKLEEQIRGKLASNEPIDVDYWEQLLRSLQVWKARVTLKKVYQSVITSKTNDLKSQQQEEAYTLRQKLQVVLEGAFSLEDRSEKDVSEGPSSTDLLNVRSLLKHLDPEPLLRIRMEDKGLGVVDEREFLDKLVSRSFLKSSGAASQFCTEQSADLSIDC